MLFAANASAAEVTVVGLSSNKAVVQIDGGPPRTLSIGQKTAEGVVLLSVDQGVAIFDISGKRRALKLGQQHATTNTSSSASATLSADARGHFVVDGQINGGTVRFLVDTGATVVSMSSGDAQRLRVDYRNGVLVRMNTANGTATAWQVKLDTVRVGDITLDNVDAVVMENQSMPVLLGMSFLNRTNMRREGQLMTLTKRF
ncbi:MAG: TIGR02281 family clan AA aspartic protease [Betaproteobacteria bacterium]|nr:TIGR02281 family clan AA aspartic protease [Betaproteobacteria bacterium]